MKCPKCKSDLRNIKVGVEGAKKNILSYQCKNCDYFEFEDKSATEVINELKEQHLKIRQKIVKLSHNRIGMYFNKHIVTSLGLKSGEEISISVPDRKHILLSLKD